MAAARRDGRNAVAVAINASDEIVGYIIDPATDEGTGFLYVNRQSYDLNALLQANSEWQITGADAINDGGEIVGAAAPARPLGLDNDHATKREIQTCAAQRRFGNGMLPPALTLYGHRQNGTGYEI